MAEVVGLVLWYSYSDYVRVQVAKPDPWVSTVGTLKVISIYIYNVPFPNHFDIGLDQKYYHDNEIYILFLQLHLAILKCGLCLCWHNYKKCILRMKVKYYQAIWMIV